MCDDFENGDEKIMGFLGICKQKGCSWYVKSEYAEHGAWFGHYWRKGREILIELVKAEGVSKNPYGEPTFILAEKLVKISKIS